MPNHIFLDLDHTIWDFDANAEETLLELYDLNNLHQYSDASPSYFVSSYQEINDELWVRYRNGEVSKEELRTSRFELTFERMGMVKEQIPPDLWLQYLQICPTKTKLIDGALDILDYLSVHHKLHLITNGFAETQRRKLKHSQLEHYFHSLTISEEVGFKKPSVQIFHQALINAGSSQRTSRYIGDSFEADVKGGLNAGWKVYWLQGRDQQAYAHPNLAKITKLAELKDHF
jgi:putative hydrolase of the HAD superfamily